MCAVRDGGLLAPGLVAAPAATRSPRPDHVARRRAGDQQEKQMMSMRTVGVAVVLGMQLVAVPMALACPPANSGVVSGSNTVDDWYYGGEFQPGTYTIGVKATGSGNNSLTIRVQRQGSGGGWSTVESSSIDMGDTDGCGTRSFQFTLDESEEIRVRLSRTVASSQINYSWDLDFTVLWGGMQHRCLTC
jgi:hypothetical protein